MIDTSVITEQLPGLDYQFAVSVPGAPGSEVCRSSYPQTLHLGRDAVKQKQDAVRRRRGEVNDLGAIDSH